MKVFSWSGLAYLFSLGFIWSCGYWLWLQTGSYHLSLQKTELEQQLEKSSQLLGRWQQQYQLHLDYLETELSTDLLQTDDTAIIDPLLQLDEQIQRILWPDPLAAYAVLDLEGRVLRFSSTEASRYFSQTLLPQDSDKIFLKPMVLLERWLIPLRLMHEKQQLILWVDATALEQQLQQLMAGSLQSTEILWLGRNAEFWSRSRFQKSLLTRLSLDNPESHQALSFFARKPPENLLRSQQRYIDAAAWPPSRIMQLSQNQPQGFVSNHYQNYLGRPTLATWRQWSDGDSILLIERDASEMLHLLEGVKFKLLFGLLVLSIALTLLFWFFSRRSRSNEDAFDSADFSEPLSETGSIEADAVATLQHREVEQSSAASFSPFQPLSHEQAAATLLRAYVAQPSTDQRLKAASLQWLEKTATTTDGQWWACHLEREVSRLLQRFMQEHPEVQILLETSQDLPAIVEIQKSNLIQILEKLLQATLHRIHQGTLLLRMIAAENQQLVIELIDQAEGLSDGQWLMMLEPLPADRTAVAERYKEIHQLLQGVGAHLSAKAELSLGNKMSLLFPCRMRNDVKLHQFHGSGSGMLLCPPGLQQQIYRRLFKHSGLDLLPMDDAAQLMKWCDSAPQDLRQIFIDEDFVQSNHTLVAKISSIVRHYFPLVQVLVATREPAKWLDLAEAEQLFVLRKPVSREYVMAAFAAKVAGMLEIPRRRIWLYHPDPFSAWWLEQQLLSLDYDVHFLSDFPQLAGHRELDLYFLPAQLRDQLDATALPEKILWFVEQPQDLQLPAHATQWSLADSIATLSMSLYQLSEPQLTSTRV